GVGPLAGAVGEADEVLHGPRRVIAEEVDDDVAVVGVERRDMSGVRHDTILAELPMSSRRTRRFLGLGLARWGIRT
ncbi:hypothetical protein ABE10_00380, partial [Bacillus toyonensis]|nr:hypothetical protein [Bacillus toyonensis]